MENFKSFSIFFHSIEMQLIFDWTHVHIREMRSFSLINWHKQTNEREKMSNSSSCSSNNNRNCMICSCSYFAFAVSFIFVLISFVSIWFVLGSNQHAAPKTKFSGFFPSESYIFIFLFVCFIVIFHVCISKYFWTFSKLNWINGKSNWNESHELREREGGTARKNKDRYCIEKVKEKTTTNEQTTQHKRSTQLSVFVYTLCADCCERARLLSFL